MALETIPAYLREPLIRSFSEQPGLAWRRNNTETGPPTYRKLTDTITSRFSVMWLLDAYEYSAFEGWFKTKINQGTSSFIIPLRTGEGVVDHEANFDGGYRSRADNKRTRITARLIAYPKQYDTDENIDDLLTALQDLFDTGDTRPSETLVDFQVFIQRTLPDEWAEFL